MGVIPEIGEGLNIVMFVENRFELTEGDRDLVQGIEVVATK